MGPTRTKATRNEQAIAMLQRPNGATAKQLAARMGIEEQSARVLVCRLKANVTKTKESGGETIYRIVI